MNLTQETKSSECVTEESKATHAAMSSTNELADEIENSRGCFEPSLYQRTTIHNHESRTSQDQIHHSTQACGGITKRGLPLAGHSRAGSICTLSRVSFSNQITQLTSIALPQATTLAEAIRCIPTSNGALCVLEDAAYQILRWIRKAGEVLSGLDAEGEVEWATAAGKDGISQVDQAISRFDFLITIYVQCVEELQLRSDADFLPRKELINTLDQIETIANLWQGTKASLEDVKRQVDLALEWAELQNLVFRQIELELDSLSGVVFEIEEWRHRQCLQQKKDLSTNVMEKNGAPRTPSTRLNTPIMSPGASPKHKDGFSKQDERLLALTSRMQPLRAALDFLPMRYTGFKSRASSTFPSACAQLETRINELERRWERLTVDADTIQKELGEDKWLSVFQSAAEQALRMIKSMRKSIAAVDESLGSNTGAAHAPNTQRKIESYEAKKAHYCPAIAQILSITDTGLNERTTINGEILRLQANIHQHWSEMKAAVYDLDTTLTSYGIEGKRRNWMSPMFSSRDMLSGTPARELRASPPSHHAIFNTESNQQQSMGSAQSPPSLTNTPSSINTGRTRTHLPITPTTPSRPAKLMSHVGERNLFDVCNTPNRPRQLQITPVITDKPRWNYSTKIDSSHSNTMVSPVSSNSSTPNRGLQASSMHSSPFGPAARFGPLESTTPAKSRKSLIPKRSTLEQNRSPISVNSTSSGGFGMTSSVKGPAVSDREHPENTILQNKCPNIRPVVGRVLLVKDSLAPSLKTAILPLR